MWKKDTYCVDFDKVEQKNMTTNKVRDVRRVKMWVWIDEAGYYYKGLLGHGDRTWWETPCGVEAPDMHIPAVLMWQVGAAV